MAQAQTKGQEAIKDQETMRVRPQFKAAATEGTPKRFIFCQN